MIYEIATLTAHPGAAPKVVAGVEGWLRDGAAQGTLIGCFVAEIGLLNTVTLIRGYSNAAEMKTERMRAMHGADPFQAGSAIQSMSFDTYGLFPWVTPLEVGGHGAFYEFRTYRLKHGGRYALSPAWEQAVPERVKRSPLATFLYTTDGAPRITHIWPYRTLDERAAVRAAAVKDGIWPPKGTADNVTEMVSWIGVPTAFSPWR
jgi:hypothetical protein